MRLSLDLLTRAVAKTKRQRPGRGPMDLNRGPMDLDALVQSVRTQRQAPRQALGHQQAPRQRVPRQQNDFLSRIPPEHRPPSSNFWGWTQPKTKAQQQAREKYWLAGLMKDENVAAAFDEWKKGGWPTPRREIMFGARPQDWTIGLDEVLDEIVSAEEGRRETIRRIGSGEILAGKRNLTAEKTKKILDGAKNDVIMAHDRIESYLAGVEWAFGEPGIEKMIERLQGEGAWPLEADLPIQGRPTPERVWK